MRPATLRLVEEMKAARSSEDAVKSLISALADHGYRYAIYDFSPLNEQPPDEHGRYTLSNIPAEWRRSHKDKFDALFNYTMQHCALFRRPLPFREIFCSYCAEEFSGPLQLLCDLALGKRLQNGIVISLRDAFPLSRGCLALISMTGQSSDQYEHDRHQHMAAIYEIAHAFHTNLHRPWLIAEDRQLSPRELECLSASMHGLRTKQIAYELGTNVRTVEKQLSGARRRLGARTNVQAAAKAVVMGLIAAN